MEMIPVKINVPREMAPLVDELSPEMEFERNAMMLYPFIWNVTISHGRAAELLGVSKLDLIEFYNRMGMPYLRLTEEDLDEELAAYKAFKKGSSKFIKKEVENALDGLKRANRRIGDDVIEAAKRRLE